MQRLQLLRDLQAMRHDVMRDENLLLAAIVGVVLTVDLVIAWFLFVE